MKFNKLHIWLWIAAIVLFITCLFYQNTNKTIDINVHDTYFVVAFYHVLKVFIIILAFLGLMYWMVDYFKIKFPMYMKFIHLGLTFGSIIAVIFAKFYFSKATKNPNFPLFDDVINENLIYTLSFLALVLGQIVFFVNSLNFSISYLFNRTIK